MFSERGIKAVAARLSVRVSPLSMHPASPSRLSARALFPVSSLPARISASPVVVPILLAEIAAFAAFAASGKIPEFLFTAIRALLTF